MERAQEPDIAFDPVAFDLASGAKVRAMMAEFWEKISDADQQLGVTPTLYFAIRIYSDEHAYPRRFTMHTEFRAGNDFEQCANHRLWAWLIDLASSRHRFGYDSVEDFLDEFAARMDEFSAIGDDAADHIHKTHGTKPPLPYEDPPHADFPEDRSSTQQKRVGDLAKSGDGGPVPDDIEDGSDTEPDGVDESDLEATD